MISSTVVIEKIVHRSHGSTYGKWVDVKVYRICSRRIVWTPNPLGFIHNMRLEKNKFF